MVFIGVSIVFAALIVTMGLYKVAESLEKKR
jgi:hypothetical protein